MKNMAFSIVFLIVSVANISMAADSPEYADNFYQEQEVKKPSMRRSSSDAKTSFNTLENQRINIPKRHSLNLGHSENNSRIRAIDADFEQMLKEVKKQNPAIAKQGLRCISYKKINKNTYMVSCYTSGASKWLTILETENNDHTKTYNAILQQDD